MPVYEYVCKDCQHPFEELILGSEKPVCPKCGSKKLEKQLSVFNPGEQAQPPRPTPGGCGQCGMNQGPGSCPMMG